MKKNVIRILRQFIFNFYTLLNPIKKQILFMSFNGQSYSDSPRAICEKIHDLYPEYELVWYLAESDKIYDIIPEYVRVVSGRWRNFLKELSVSQCFVSNTEMHNGIFKRKGQYFIQTWHGNIGFKKVLYECNITDKNFCYDDKYTDCALAGSDESLRIYRKAFRYNGFILNEGMPRNDCLLNHQKNINEIKEQLNIDKNAKVLLYAPTFRDKNVENQSSNVNLTEVLNHLENKGEKWICLIRAHPNVKNFKTEIDNRFYNVSSYPDMSDILVISDMLISDYSSCASDFILTKKPTILYQNDRQKYISDSRELVFDAKTEGFLVAENMDELYNIIDKYSDSDYENNCEMLIKHFNIIENKNSSEIICNLIHGELMKRFG